MESTDIAYIAGIVDGEGTITLSKINKDDTWRTPVVSVSSTTYEILSYLQSLLGGSISKHKVYQDHHKQSWSWKVTARQALAVTQLVSGYLLEPDKRRRAILLNDKYLSVTPRNGKYSESLADTKREFESEFFHPSTGAT